MSANIVLANGVSSAPNSPAEYTEKLTQKLEMDFQTAVHNRDYASQQQKLHYNKRVKHVPYVTGALEWLNDPTTSEQKLAPHWKGPFVV